MSESKTHRVDDEGCRHALWCAGSEPGCEDPYEACDCNPCNCCDGHGEYGDEDGKPMDCIQCSGFPFKKTGERNRRDR